MVTVNIRKQGGAAIVTIPAHLLKKLDVSVGATLGLEVIDDKLVASPLSLSKTHKRYSIKELLAGVTPTVRKKLIEETSWAREGEPQGRELI